MRHRRLHHQLCESDFADFIMARLTEASEIMILKRVLDIAQSAQSVQNVDFVAYHEWMRRSRSCYKARRVLKFRVETPERPTKPKKRSGVSSLLFHPIFILTRH